MDAAPKRVYVDMAAISSTCSRGVERECHVDVVLVRPRRCRVGAYGLTHLAVQVQSKKKPVSVVQPVHSSYVVSENHKYVDVEVTRTRHSTSPPSSVDVAFVSSTGSPFIDFHFQEERTLTWQPDGNATQTFRVYVRPNHEHVPNDTVYLTFVNPEHMQLPAQAPMVEVVILNANDSESVAERNMTQSAAFRQRIMPWLSEVKDMHAAQRLLEAWNAYPVEEGEVVIARGRVPRFLAIVAEGTFSIEAPIFGQQRTRKARKGDLVSFFSAVKRTNSSTEVKAMTKGLLLVLDHHVFHLHNKSAHQDIYKVLKHEFLRQTIMGDGRRFPVVMVPGFMSTQLEAWKRKDCNGVDIEIMDQVWLSLEQMMQTITVDRYCWLECLALGINQTDDTCKVRAGSGIAAIRELNANIRGITTIFRSILTFLAEKWGYDSQSLIAMPYDWRLSPDMLQRRDKFFSTFKAKVEMAVAVNEAPAVLIAHSLGNQVILEFFAWLEKEFPKSFLKWTEKHIIAYYGIAPAFRGATQAVVADLIGDNMGLPVTNYQARVFGSTVGSSPWMFPVSVRTPTAAEWTCSHPYCGEGATTLRLRRPHTLDELKTRRAVLNEYETMCQAAQWHTPLDQPEVEQADTSDIRAFLSANGTDETGGIEEGGWPRYLINITLGNGTELVFGVNDLRTGKLFQDLARYGNDSHAQRVADTIRHFYTNKEISSPLDRLPTRPPIKHVAIVYGVNRNTPYAIHATQTKGTDELTLTNQVLEMQNGELSSGNNASNSLRCSGDGTVPYASLSWVHAWHLSQSVSIVRNQQTVQPFFDHAFSEYTPEQVSRVIDTVIPEHTVFDSDKHGYRTTVVEVEGLEHRDAVRTTFTTELIDNLMQDLVQVIVHDATSDVELLQRGVKDIEQPPATTTKAVTKHLRSLLAEHKHDETALQRITDVIAFLEDKH
ncbi:hypothetical protein PTSG_08974 [Salpingoeca rosetta]|uniref:Cyclic nucleotide-binding domain-containing protein n=1 Tax=Salpingoeca rosetta (strain ATCC 50818 / BSB-021) TaxID=946362 RepID=F2ULU6_SALR5|nr:uncharacterized protein PTSG_08974 [Salpingoeca rosetta]EGD78095.1 hypothetical protein PTSG_08974 [Salpingoeca rosetta]|eukprot:XP_004989771.1 hypothetical protein PTSG_08974 [Salpingoeca rosetta]